MKAHVTKPTPGIKMPKYHVQKAAPAPKPQKQAKTPTAKRLTSPALKLPTIPQHREKLAGMVPPASKKGKQ